KFSLEPGGPKRLKMSWGWRWGNLTLRLDGNPIGMVADEQELVAGRAFALADGSTLRVQLVRKFLYPRLRLLRNGQPLPGSASGDLRRRFGIVYVLGLLLIAGGIAAVQHYLSFGRTSPLELPDKPSLVVLPFTNLSDKPEHEYFSDGMAAELTDDLSRLPGLFVIDIASAFRYREAKKSQGVSRGLGVRYVVKGGARRIGDQVEITVQLGDATAPCYVWAECSLWTERYQRPGKELFALQDEIAQKIVATLGVQLTPQEQERLRQVETNNLEAYDYFQRAYRLYLRGTEEANAQARHLAERAIELDPQYAGAHVLLGVVYWQQWFRGWSQNPQIMRQAVALAQQAIVLNNSRADAHALLAYAYLLEGQHDQAIAEGERAIALNVNFADAYATLGLVLYFAGRPEEAVAALKKALRLNPRHPESYFLDVGRAYWLAGQHEEAEAAYKNALDHNPADVEAHIGLAVVYHEAGQEGKAQDQAEAILEIDPGFSLASAGRRWAPYKDPMVLQRILTALRKAGVQ
ncbi:MAG: tetratricopeptide repeat protein, partial [Candidatus Binatia bacterium]